MTIVKSPPRSTGTATVSTLNVRAVATPDPVAPGQRVNFALTVSNTGAATHAVAATATVPLNATVARTELSLPAYCDGVSGFVTCAAGQTLQFVTFNVPAGGAVTVVYPALVSSSAAPANGALLDSDLWVQDITTLDEYQVNVAAVAQHGAIAASPPAAVRAVFAATRIDAKAERPTVAGHAAAVPDRRSAGTSGRPAASAPAPAAGSPAATPPAGTLATPARIVIALDGALTAGVRDVANSPTRWPRLLAERILEELDTTQLLVSEPDLGTVSRPLDLGRELGSLPPGALSQGGAKYVIVLPDIANEATAAQLIARQRHAIEQAHALGLKVFGGTVPAFEGTRLPNHTPVTETTRETVNDWIRRSGAYDGVIDFDLATSDPLHPARLLPAYDGGDHLHPNQAGYRAMADAIDLSLFED